jgi:hypothetical protein
MKKSLIFEAIFYGKDPCSILFEKHSKENSTLYHFKKDVDYDGGDSSDDEEMKPDVKTSGKFSFRKILKKETLG